MKYSDEEKRRVIAESRETLRRVDKMFGDPRSDNETATSDLSAAAGFFISPVVEPRVETRNERHRRELDEQDRQFARERSRRDHRLDTRQISISDVETLIAAALAEERAAVIPTLRSAIDELLDGERERVVNAQTEQMRSLELQVAKLESALSALQVVLVVERGKAIDLPNPLQKVN
jgi:hypothetical protein